MVFFIEDEDQWGNGGGIALAEPDNNVWGARHQNKLKSINHITYDTFKL